jgi:hypothetical protein
MKKILLSSSIVMMLVSSTVFAAGSSSIDAMMGGYAYGNEANTSVGFCAGSGASCGGEYSFRNYTHGSGAIPDVVSVNLMIQDGLVALYGFPTGFTDYSTFESASGAGIDVASGRMEPFTFFSTRRRCTRHLHFR